MEGNITENVKILTLHRDKAYRAKIENKEVYKDDFFYDVYINAWEIVENIIQDMTIFYEKESRSEYAARFVGLGNNIVFFNGGRGDGKTSAMRSFAQCLMGNIKLGDEENRENKNKYIVLDSIDPSAMESGENILRVVISRMYHMFEKQDPNLLEKQGDRDKYRKNKLDLCNQFQKCYENIDSIKSDKEEDYDTDDLDKLSKLGSSAGLKECIYETVAKFLKIVNPKASGMESYLVVVIDDMDLATKKVHKICEDIRNYLSVPNVIVLFSADYEQLIYAVYQKYQRRYHSMKEYWTEFDMEKECYTMTGRYLEKLFPIGHRIELPRLEEIIANRNMTIKLQYYRYDKDKEWVKEDYQKELDKNCTEIQEQLLRRLYVKTGIIFLREKGVMHYILPRTLRELTHFTRMLDDMENLDEKISFEKRQEVLANNISLFKRYFINYWCVNHLSLRQKKMVERIIRINENRNIKQVIEYIKKCKGSEESDKTSVACNEGSYWDIRSDVKSVFCEEKELQEAIGAYYTIFLNEWFAISYEKANEISKIALFMKRMLTLNQKDYDLSEIIMKVLPVKEETEKKPTYRDFVNIRNLIANYEIQDYLELMVQQSGSEQTEGKRTEIENNIIGFFDMFPGANENTSNTASENAGREYNYIDSFPFKPSYGV